ncbi:hypothetical protein P7K49_033061 [Saguinus oedipus]|uniref:Uncharacterized protein n=1 Tax=Saguinus oedipus TaxID=9490 RepID=A0ABQ9TQV0_SAGOE|nr:hypothetical protein P7K49_033061 [Saguinus oedipus]
MLKTRTQWSETPNGCENKPLGWEAKAWEGQHRKIPTPGEPLASNSPLRARGGKQEDRVRQPVDKLALPELLTHCPLAVPPALCPRPGLPTLYRAGIEGLSSQETLELAVQLARAVFPKASKVWGTAGISQDQSLRPKVPKDQDAKIYLGQPGPRDEYLDKVRPLRTLQHALFEKYAGQRTACVLSKSTCCHNTSVIRLSVC